MNSTLSNSRLYERESSLFPRILSRSLPCPEVPFYQTEPVQSPKEYVWCAIYQDMPVQEPQIQQEEIYCYNLEDFCLCDKLALQKHSFEVRSLPSPTGIKEISAFGIPSNSANYLGVQQISQTQSQVHLFSQEMQGRNGHLFSPFWVRAQYKSRKDVVYKAIFRRMRKFFTEDFQTTMGKKSIKSRYLQKVKEYCRIRFPNSDNEAVSTIFNCIINSRERLGKIRERDQLLKTKVADLVYMFSERRLKMMEDHPEFFDILLYFLNQPNTVNLISDEGSEEYFQKLRIHLGLLMRSATHRRVFIDM
ncbi:unnamed protein product [Moneuplotes crassus]|uniref:Uncharacterized protein n=1 Tax=Euplotes crassus TaxID=5936 RepID=A0AAD1X7Q4_EUPCR|nr:unnamed protein product [Moneuplotes crassus]